MHISLVRRKILRLYKAGALIMHAYYSPHPPCVLIRLPRYGGENTCAIMTFRDIL